MTSINADGRHPSTQHIVRYFAYDHLPPHLQAVSKPAAGLVQQMLDAPGVS